MRLQYVSMLMILISSCAPIGGGAAVPDSADGSPVLSVDAALRSFVMPAGYRLEIVAAEPLVHDPVAIDFDADGRMYVVEMRGYMPNVEADGEDEPIGRIVVLEDRNGDGRMDHRSVFLDDLVLPRAIKVLDAGVLVAAPPYLWLVRDSDGDGVADSRTVVRDDYGNPESNPEHNANGLIWGMDNWIHSSQYDWQVRIQAGELKHRQTVRRGQWGVSSDDFGRLYRNFNEAPLHVDLVPGHYLARNPALTRPRGAYEQVAPNGPVWPVRPTPGVNRGYRDGVLREDGTLAEFTAAGSPVVYRGDRLPAELNGNVFVTEPAGNLVRRYVLAERPDGTLAAGNAYDQQEFLASTDERFRPVNVYSAPDGTLYVVDMYRGVIQHRDYLTDYLTSEIHARGLERPVGLGRIYRVVHGSTRRDSRPNLSTATPDELVELLSHRNGWWRSMAQQLLFERGHRDAAPRLTELVRSAHDEVTRLHAIWTLEGLRSIDPALLTDALDDGSPHLRAAAIRVTEPFLAQDHGLLRAVTARVADPVPFVRWQLAASLGELPPAERIDALAPVLARLAADPIAVDAAISGLAELEVEMLAALLAHVESPAAPAVTRLASTAVRAERAADHDRILAWIGEEARPAWQRLALLDGLRSILPTGAQAAQVIRFHRRPEGLFTAARAADADVRGRAAELLAVADWPGNPEPRTRDRESLPLTEAQVRAFEAGRAQYQALCAACHQESGLGMEGVATPLVESRWVLGDPDALIRIVAQGLEGEMFMPPLGGALSDEALAAVLTYIRRDWGHQASAVSPNQVRETRVRTADRTRPWTDEELLDQPR
jgi:mono/diheme cytochrome c family protein/glucose/arabinose dehydrogenase